MVKEMMMINNDDDHDDDDDDDADDDNGDDDEVDWLAWFSAKAVNSPLPNSPLSVPTKMFFCFNRGHCDGDDSVLTYNPQKWMNFQRGKTGFDPRTSKGALCVTLWCHHDHDYHHHHLDAP